MASLSFCLENDIVTISDESAFFEDHVIKTKHGVRSFRGSLQNIDCGTVNDNGLTFQSIDRNLYTITNLNLVNGETVLIDGVQYAILSQGFSKGLHSYKLKG